MGLPHDDADGRARRWLLNTILESWDFRRNARDMLFRPALAGAGRLAPLDGVRALAFMWVTADHGMKSAQLQVYHSDDGTSVFLNDDDGTPLDDDHAVRFSSSLASLEKAASFGVTLFFVLSGFLIIYILVDMHEREEGGMSYPRFVARRFFRIWPSLNFYWAASMPLFLYCMPGKHDRMWWYNFSKPCRLYGWTNLVFFTNFSVCYSKDHGAGTPYTCQDHLWTVSTEFQMYLVTPVFARLFVWHEAAGFASVLAALGAATWWSLVAFHRQNVDGATYNCYLADENSSLYCVGEYAMGMLCGMSYLASTRRGDAGRWWALAPGRGC